MRALITGAGIALVALCPVAVHAQEATPTTSPLGIEEKLKEVYDLYRMGNVVTLEKSEFRAELELGYALNESRVFGFQETTRTLSAIGTLAYGITDGMELSLALPLIYREQKAESSDATFLDEQHAGLGDVTLGLAATIPVPWVSTTGLVSISLPTATDDLGSDGVTTSIGFNVDKVMQPAFVYGGLAWVRDWGESQDAVGYTAGVGFFLNYALSIGAELDGSYLFNPEQGMPNDMLSLVGRVSYQATPSFGVTPSVGVGLTESAPDVQLGLRLAWRF